MVHSLAQPQPATEPASVLTTVVLPAYNEAEALPLVLAELTATLDDQYEIVVVDDGSTDATVSIAAGFPCQVVRHPERRGKGAAVRSGIAQARGQYIIVSDADATYPVQAIPRIVTLLAEHDLVRCSRQPTAQAMPAINRVGNWLFNRLLAGVHGLAGDDHLSGLYGLRRSAVIQLNLQSEGFDLEAEIGIKARAHGLRVASFPIVYQPRLGDKKLRPWRDGLAILNRIAALVLLYNPLATFIAPGLILLLVALALAAALERGPVITPYFGLSIHSFIVATLGVLAAFQLVVFGMAAALYGVEAGYRPPRWLVAVSARRIRLGAVAVGLVLAVLAAGRVTAIVWRWFATGAAAFEDTRTIVLAATVTVLGLQILSAALFLSIFAGRLSRLEPPAPGDGQPG
jgi:hypothetical protein